MWYNQHLIDTKQCRFITCNCIDDNTIQRWNVVESQITQSLKVRDLGVTFDQFLKFNDNIIAICRSTYFHIRNIGKIRNLLSYIACSTIILALISCRLDYCITFLRIKLIACKNFRINAHVY